jgi:uncharacterized SAM-binding protein YcdF (DUF218 family)
MTIPDTDVTAALVLGASVSAFGPSPTLIRRTRHAAALWHRGEVGLVIPCGGGPGPLTEAAAMTAILVESGVAPEAILPEPSSRTTWENLENARDLIRALPTTQVRIVVVTDAYHMPRALLAARALGLRAGPGAPPWGSARVSAQIKGALREIPALGLYIAKAARTRLMHD